MAAKCAMIRRMTTYPTRETVSLDGLWDFHFDAETSLEAFAPGALPFDDTMPVPSAFDATPAYLIRRGLAIYRRTFRLERDCPDALLRIGSCGLRGRFWVDGRTVGAADMPYNAFAFRTGPLAAGEHEVVAVCDNRFNAEKMPFFLPYYDFYAYGGLYRGVTVETLPQGIRLDRVQVRTTDLAVGRVELRVLLLEGADVAVDAAIRFDGGAEARIVPLEFRGGVATVECAVPNARVWSLESPAMHTVEVRCGDDAVVETFGIRTFEARDGKFWLNGKPIRLFGFNRHESHPDFGPAVPPAVMASDLQRVRACHANFLRGAHYPQDPAFLDLCDRMGVLVWEEGLAWGNTPEQLANPVFADGQVAQIRRMVRASVNHPSVVIWGFLNEFASESDAGVALCRRLMDACHEEDASRPATFACNRGTSDRCVPLADIVAYNTYPGWCDGNPRGDIEDMVAPDRDRLLAHFKAQRKPGAPIMVSEMGVCALYGHRDPAASQWSEEFQERYLRRVVEEVLGCEDLQGLAIWQFCDAKSYHREGASLRVKPLALNTAGVFDVYRRPKKSAEMMFNGIPGVSLP